MSVRGVRADPTRRALAVGGRRRALRGGLDRGPGAHDPERRRGGGRRETSTAESFAAWIEPRSGTLFEPRNEIVFLEWAGDEQIPPWTAVRTADLKLIRYGDGFEELYDIGGSVGSADPWEMTNVVDDPRYAGALARLRALLGRVLGPR